MVTKHNADPIPEELPKAQCRAAVSVGTVLVVFAWLSLYFPHRRVEITRSDCCNFTKKISDADQTSVGIALFTAGVGFVLYGLNGLRLTKLSFGGASAEASRRESMASAEKVRSMDPAGAVERAAVVAAAGHLNFAEFTPEEKKILVTLARFQRQHDPTNANRWGFGVGAGAVDYAAYLRGTGLLYSKGLVAIDLRGMVYLNDHGIQFAEQNRPAIEEYPAYYQDFRAP